MFINKISTYLTAHISQSKRRFNMKSSTYYFHVKTKILADFQICISAPLMNLLFRTIPENICCFPKCLKSRLTKQFLSFKTSSRRVCKTYSRSLGRRKKCYAENIM